MPTTQIIRIPISRKRRFDIFKRDGFKCQYCGAFPPEVILEVDHITPVCRRGDNSDANLITSCFDCNRGKGGRPISDILTHWENNTERITERESQIAAYRDAVEAQMRRIDADAYEIFSIMMPCVDPGEYWVASIKGFMDHLEYDELIEAAQIAFRKRTNKNSDTFSYFCGVCWRKIERKKDVL